MMIIIMPRYFSSVALFFEYNSSGMCCKLSKCCCGCSLQTGSKVIGILSLLAGITLFLKAIIAISNLNFQDGNNDQLASDIGILLGAVVVIAISFSVFFAAWKNSKPILLVPWLVLNALALPFLIAFIMYFKDRWLTGKTGGACTGTGVIAWGLIVVGIWFYFWLVINSYYHQLKNMKKPPPLPDEKTIMRFRECENNVIRVDQILTQMEV